MNDGVMPQQRVIDMISGYWLAQLVGSFAKLGIADVLARGSRAADAIAEACSASPAGMRRLLRAAAAFGLLETTAQGEYRLTALGGTLRGGGLGSMRDYAIATCAPGHWQPWGRLDEAVRAGKPSFDAAFGRDIWTYYAEQPAEGAHFARAMGNLSQLAALDVVAHADVGDARRIVDVGGSRGELLRALLCAVPEARGVLFDRPGVVAQAAPDPRIEVIGGDFFASMPPGGDIYLLKQILHDWEDGECLTILRNIHAASAPDARLLIVEMLLPERAEPSPAWLVDLNMLVLLGGRERTQAEYEALLDQAGFALAAPTALRGGFHLLEARRQGH